MLLQPADTPDIPQPEQVDDPIGLILETLQSWWEGAISRLPNLAVALVVAILFWILGRVLRSIAERGLQRTPLPEPVRKLITGLVGFTAVVAGFFIALGVLGLDRTVTSLLAGVGILGLALGFAFQDIAANFMSGLMLAFRRPFNVGDRIETHDYVGFVKEISLRSTVLRQPTGEIVRIPNRMVYENPLMNVSEMAERRIDLVCGVSYGDDLAKAKEIALAALDGVSYRLPDREAQLFYKEFGGSSIDFVVRFWVEYKRHAHYLEARSEAIQRIKQAFDQNGITIPFPIRTLDFGIVGGKGLGEELEPLAGRAAAEG